MTTSRAVLLYGTNEPLPQRLHLRAGPLDMAFEEGAIRWVTTGGIELVRGIQFVLRDRNWGTPKQRLLDLRLDRSEDAFVLTFRGAFDVNDAHLVCAGRIEGTAAGTVQFTAELIPGADFETGRAGFVVLYPLASTVGRPVSVLQSHGALARDVFPAHVAPEPIWSRVRSVVHEPAPGMTLRCRMAGDDFECEDHRNWTDASFKFYSRPIALPYPYVLQAGARVRQSVSLTVDAPTNRSRQKEQRVVEIGIDDVVIGSMPEIGVVLDAETMELARRNAPVLGRVGLQTLSARIDLADQDALDLARAAAQLASPCSRLRLDVVFADWQTATTQLAQFLSRLEEIEAKPTEIVPLSLAELSSANCSPGAEGRETLLRFLHRAFPECTIGGGTLGSFYQLRRCWRPSEFFKFVSYETSSTVHAADDCSVMETLQSLPYQFQSARAIAGDKPIHIGAANIGLDYNPDGDLIPNPERKRVALSRNDPRQAAQFGAAWGLGFLAQAALGGIYSVILGKAAGPSGIIADNGTCRPLYHVLAGLASCAGRSVLATRNTAPDQVQVLACGVGSATRVWLANLTPDPVEVRVASNGRRLQLEMLVSAGSFAVDQPARPLKLKHKGSAKLLLDAFAVAQGLFD